MLKILNFTNIQATHGSDYTDQILNHVRQRSHQCSHQQGIYHLSLDTFKLEMKTHDKQEIMFWSHTNIQRLEQDIKLFPFKFILNPRLGLYKILNDVPTLSEFMRNLEAAILHMVEEGQQGITLWRCCY